MKNMININNIGVELSTKDSKVFATSKDIASVFGKRNADVTKSIESILTESDLKDEKVRLSNYKASNGKDHKMYELDRDIFSLVVMGFTGEKAMVWKRSFIEAFNKMEEELIQIYKDKLNLQLAEKDATIDRLVTEKKLCILYDDDFSTVRGIAQRCDYTEKQIRDWVKRENILSRHPVATFEWKVKTPSFIVKQDKKGTPILHMPSIIRLMDEDNED